MNVADIWGPGGSGPPTGGPQPRSDSGDSSSGERTPATETLRAGDAESGREPHHSVCNGESARGAGHDHAALIEGCAQRARKPRHRGAGGAASDRTGSGELAGRELAEGPGPGCGRGAAGHGEGPGPLLGHGRV